MPLNNTEPQARLLCQAVIHPLSPETQVQLSRLSQPDWDAFLRLAGGHGLLPLLHTRLEPLTKAGAIPDDICARLQDSYITNTARNMLLLHHASEMIVRLTAAGIPVIGLKGLYLLDNVYANIGERLLNDLDLMVPEAQLPAAIDVMENLGYRQMTYFNPQDANPDIKHVPPFKKSNGPYTELHWSIVEEHWGFTINTQGLWARAIPTKIAGTDALALCLEDLLLHLAIHCTYQHHLRAGLRALYDLAVLLDGRQDQIDWEALVTRAEAWGAARIAWLTLRMVDDLFHIKTPQNALDRLLGEAEDPAILAQARVQVLQPPGETAVMMTPDLAGFAGTPGLLGKLRVVMRRVFIPKRAIAREYNVPPNSIRLYFYYPVRFWHLFLHYSRSAWGLLWKQKATLSSAAQEDANQQLLRWMMGAGS